CGRDNLPDPGLLRIVHLPAAEILAIEHLFAQVLLVIRGTHRRGEQRDVHNEDEKSDRPAKVSAEHSSTCKSSEPRKTSTIPLILLPRQLANVFGCDSFEGSERLNHIIGEFRRHFFER